MYQVWTSIRTGKHTCGHIYAAYEAPLSGLICCTCIFFHHYEDTGFSLTHTQCQCVGQLMMEQRETVSANLEKIKQCFTFEWKY